MRKGKMPSLTYHEFFAGGGMARLGLGSDWECLFANEWCEKKAAAYRRAFGDGTFKSCAQLVVKDVAMLDPSEVKGHADLAWASFPCQDLSLAGNGAGLSGTRSGTFHAFWSLMKKLRTESRAPRIIALENVTGALTSHGGADFRTIIRAIAEEGYRVGALVIDAKRFLPQSRPRLFIVAIRNGSRVPECLTSDEPASCWHPDRLVEAHAHLGGAVQGAWLWWTMPAPPRRKLTLADLIEAEPTGVRWNSEAETRRLLDMMTEANLNKVRQAMGMRSTTVGTLYRRTRLGIQRAEARFDGIAGCLRTPAGGSSRQTLIVVRGGEVRSRLFSARELAGLMGVDDSYPLPQNYNESYHLFGDGLAVPAVSWLAQNLLTPLARSTPVSVAA